jgi:filamentous hemagglutinin family protein
MENIMNTVFKSMLKVNSELTKINFNKKYSKIYLATMLSLGAVSISHANIVVDTGAPKNQQPGISTYEGSRIDPGYNHWASGPEYPLINIQTPGANGLSHNKYTQFDVNGREVALNNMVSHVTDGNPNLVTQSADVILNEINSANSSQLNGKIKVFGDNAHVIFANPSGIDCNGCEFINAHQVTLTSGAPVFENGLLDKFSVNKGDIVIGAEGLKSEGYLNLLSESVKIYGHMKSNDILVIAGKNDINFTEKQFKSLEQSPEKTGVDVSELGGMYANKITIISKNRHVKNQGNIEGYNISINAENSEINNDEGSIKGLYRVGAYSEQINEFKNNDGIKLISENLYNQGGRIKTARRNIDIDSSINIINKNGVINTGNSSGIIIAETRYIINTDGELSSGLSLALNTDSINNNKGIISSANSNVYLNYGNLINETGNVSAVKIINNDKNSNTYDVIYSNNNVEMSQYNRVHFSNGSAWVYNEYRPKQDALVKTLDIN